MFRDTPGLLLNRAGDDLIDYANRQLFPYLQDFRQRATGPDTIEYKIGEIVSEIKNCSQSGYSLRDALELAHDLRFRSQKEKHELSHLYQASISNMGGRHRQWRVAEATHAMPVR